MIRPGCRRVSDRPCLTFRVARSPCPSSGTSWTIRSAPDRLAARGDLFRPVLSTARLCRDGAERRRPADPPASSRAPSFVTRCAVCGVVVAGRLDSARCDHDVSLVADGHGSGAGRRPAATWPRRDHRSRATPRGVLSGAHDGDDVRVQRQPPTCRWTLGRRCRPCVAAAAPAATSPRSGAKLRICAALATFPGRPTEPAAAQSLRSAAQPCSRGDRMKALVPHATLHDDWNEALRDDPRPSLTGSCNCRSATAAAGPRRLLR